MKTLEQRFFEKIARGPNGCIVWTGAQNEGGYGRMWVGARGSTPKLATHVSWFIAHEVWPNQQVLHTCDNPACVNPDHLFLGTQQDNIDDCIAKGRKPREEACSYAKLSDADVAEIRRLHQTRMSLAEIGTRFGINPQTVSHLAKQRYRSAGEPLPTKPYVVETLNVCGKQMSIDEIASAAGIGYEAVRSRYARGLRGKDLIAPKHKAKRKAYVRQR